MLPLKTKQNKTKKLLFEAQLGVWVFFFLSRFSFWQSYQTRGELLFGQSQRDSTTGAYDLVATHKEVTELC